MDRLALIKLIQKEYVERVLLIKFHAYIVNHAYIGYSLEKFGRSRGTLLVLYKFETNESIAPTFSKPSCCHKFHNSYYCCHT